MTQQTYARLYATYTSATDAVRALEAAGFSEDNISVISRQHEDNAHPNLDETAAGTGATVGTLVGGGAGLLAGIGLLAIPGIGPLVAAGWMVAALTGAGAGAAAGGLLGSLVSSGVDELDAKAYAEGVEQGGTLVTVRADDTRIARAQEIMDQHGPTDTTALAAGYRTTDYAPDGTPGNPPGTLASRATDDALGTNISGARPQHDAYNPPGTAASRALDDAAGTNVSGARPQNEAYNPPGTAASRALDDAAGTNVSGARPQNSDGTPNNPPGTAASRTLDKVAGTNVSGAHPENEPVRR